MNDRHFPLFSTLLQWQGTPPKNAASDEIALHLSFAQHTTYRNRHLWFWEKNKDNAKEKAMYDLEFK